MDDGTVCFLDSLDLSGRTTGMQRLCPGPFDVSLAVQSKKTKKGYCRLLQVWGDCYLAVSVVFAELWIFLESRQAELTALLGLCDMKLSGRGTRTRNTVDH